MMFGVPDEFTDMTRSLEMVERQRLIYLKVMYGHRNGSEEIRGFIGVPGGYRNPPRKLMGLMGQERECTSHKGLVRPHSRPAYEEKERGEGKESVE